MKKITTLATLSAFIFYLWGCSSPLPLQIDQSTSQAELQNIVLIETQDGYKQEIDCDSVASVTYQNDVITITGESKSVLIIPHSQIKNVYSNQFNYSKTIGAVFFWAFAIPVTYALFLVVYPYEVGNE